MCRHHIHLFHPFVKWQAAGNPCKWESYLYQIFGISDFDGIDWKKDVGTVGIEVVGLEAWPGFCDLYYAEIDEYTQQIINISGGQEQLLTADSEQPVDLYKKAKPEAEAYSIIRREREGDYYIISERGEKHPAWFISHTSILNILKSGIVITWQPQAFLSFASTLCAVTEADVAKQAFERLILGLAQSGLNLLDDETIGRVFGTVIDQARLDIEELRQEYQEVLQSKYGESVDSVLARVSPAYHPVVVRQLSAEIFQAEARRRHAAEIQAVQATKRAEASEGRLEKLEKFRTKLLRKQSKPKKQHRTSKRKRKRK